MGPIVKLSNKLLLRVENESKANEVLDMYLRNKTAFERFEPTRPHDFYTIDYHEEALRREFKAYQFGAFIRYYIYLRPDLNKIIGSINFNFRYYDEERFAEIGYKVDSLYQNQGIAYEACRLGIEVMLNDYNISRIDARIHPDNCASRHLAEKLGFKYVCTEPKSTNILGREADLLRYTLATSDIQ